VRTKSVVHGLRRQKNTKERKKVRNGTNTLFMMFKEKSYIIMLNLASNVGVYSVEAVMEVLRRTQKLSQGSRCPGRFSKRALSTCVRNINLDGYLL